MPDFQQAIATQEIPSVDSMQVWRLSKTRNICEADPPEDADQAHERTCFASQAWRLWQCSARHPKNRVAAVCSRGSHERARTTKMPPLTRSASSHKMSLIPSVPSPTRPLTMMGINLDYARPDWMILSALPVPPPPVRPSISVDGSGQGQRGEDDLTFKLGDIIRANQAVLRTEVDGTPDHIKVDLCDLLQYHIATYMDNEIAGLDKAQHKSGRPIKSSPCSTEGQRRPSSSELDGEACRFLGSYRYHWRSEPFSRRSWCSSKYCSDPDLPRKSHAEEHRLAAQTCCQWS